MNITNESEIEDFYKLSDDVLHKINKLSIRDCNKLQSLVPGNFGNLIALKKLDINNCNSLKYLPIDFSSLKALRILRIVNCNGLISLPDTIGLCFNLKKFIISDIKLLPPSIILLPNVVIKNNFKRLKILGNGEIKSKIQIEAHQISASAKTKIEKAGGSVNLLKQAEAK